MNTTILSTAEALATLGVRFGRQSVLRTSMFSEVFLFKEKQIAARSSVSKCHIPCWCTKRSDLSPEKPPLIINKSHIPE